jgi:hypothetical protein
LTVKRNVGLTVIVYACRALIVVTVWDAVNYAH